jgi:hypothetical protein
VAQALSLWPLVHARLILLVTKDHRLKPTLLISVQILRKKLCGFCASLVALEENFLSVTGVRPICGELSSQFTKHIHRDAQPKRIPAARCAAFPHFHSDGCYYGLYTYFKTG